MRTLLTSFIKLLSAIIGRRNLERALILSAKSLDINLHKHGLIQIGALSGFDASTNGEAFFMDNILPSLLPTERTPLLFDVGGNVGEYSIALRANFPHAEILAFEPVATTFTLLEENTKGKDINVFNFGFSDTTGTIDLFNTVDAGNNQIASVYKDVFTGVFNTSQNIQSQSFRVDTIDTFCQQNNIHHIDFLKIDVEGHEYAVLKGAAEFLALGEISIIQLEFNTHNLYSHVSLRDFYELLKDHSFYRSHPQGLVQMGKYDPVNEIYTAQNIVAIHHSLLSKLNTGQVLRYE